MNYKKLAVFSRQTKDFYSFTASYKLPMFHFITDLVIPDKIPFQSVKKNGFEGILL